jgi:hypothetical protein
VQKCSRGAYVGIADRTELALFFSGLARVHLPLLLLGIPLLEVLHELVQASQFVLGAFRSEL